MKRINILTVKQVKESGKLYELDTKVVRSPQDAEKIIQTVLDLNSEAKEKFGILTLNTKNEVNGIHVLFIGSLNSSIVHPRDVFQACLLNNAASFVAFHNHPSGNPDPSKEDIAVTKRLDEAGKILGIECLDHIITGSEGRFVSLKEKGYL
jgi:DNA repair protein RadC